MVIYVMDICSKHQIKLPSKYTMLMRSVASIEGVIEQLCPELNFVELVSDKLMDRAKKSFDLKQELLNKGKEVLDTGKKLTMLPNLAADALNSIVRGRMKVNMELTGYEELEQKIAEFVKYIVLAMLSCVLFLGSCVLCLAEFEPKTSTGLPLLAVMGLVFSVALALFSVKKMSGK